MSTVPAAPTDPATTGPAATDATPSRIGPLLVAFAVGTLAAVALGVYGRVHTPTGQAVYLAGFSSGLAVKAFLTSVAMVLAVVQTVTAMALFGRLRLTGTWVAPVHRWSGRIAVAVTVPVAVHCLYALGFSSSDTRTLVHLLFGCFFYGAFVVKMLVLARDDSPRWALPLMGGLVLSGLTALWMTAALWFYLR